MANDAPTLDDYREVIDQAIDELAERCGIPRDLLRQPH